MPGPFDPNDPMNRNPSPYAPRSTARLDAMKAALNGEDLSLPTAEEIEAASGDPEQMQALLARAKYAEQRLQQATGKDYLMDAGRLKVANPWGAISDIFVRGNAMKERDTANKSAAELGRAQTAAQAKLARGELVRSRADEIDAQLREAEEANRRDAQAEAAERTRVTEREQDRSDKSLRDQLDESYRNAELNLRRKEADDARQYREDMIGVDRERIAAETAGLNAKASAAQVANQNAYNTWGTAATQYLEAARNTTLGGNPLTGSGRIAGATRANLAPVLKGIFRSAGEGTFTDKDQELLMDMAPTAFDSDSVAAQKLRNIDGIIRAKLGMGNPSADESEDPYSAERKRRGL